MTFRPSALRCTPWAILLLSGIGSLGYAVLDSAKAEEEPAEPVAAEVSLTEARGRAKMLHEAMHGALQVMHRDLFDEDRSHTIPSRSLEDVFKEMEKSHDVSLRWLVVNATAMNVDNNPRDDFEKQAVQALIDGKSNYEQVEEGRYRFAGPIRLASQCLKCHVPFRKSNDDRMAGLVISMPITMEK